jgi:SAM-dependent methyltransferase
MTTSLQEVRSYYDEHVIGKIRGFIEVNPRVERAWLTIEQWAPNNPQRILEVGCGIGDISWRMSHRWLESEVVGLDVSRKSLEIAQKLFTSPRLSFLEGPLTKGRIIGKFDLIVLMDVYEHIAVADRSVLHEALRELRSDEGRIVLSFPTPHHQAWLRKHKPDGIQPVDEDIHGATILKLASDTETEVLLYQEVNVWHEGDYAHAVLGTRKDRVVATNTHLSGHRSNGLIHKFLLRQARLKRIALVHKKLGSEYYPRK